MAAPEQSPSSLEVCLQCGLHTAVTVNVRWKGVSASRTPLQMHPQLSLVGDGRGWKKYLLQTMITGIKPLSLLPQS